MSTWDRERLSDEEFLAKGEYIHTTTRDRWGDEVGCFIEKDTLYGTDAERGVGHSVRACKYRKADVARRTIEVAERRVAHLNRMLSNGIGPGASVVFCDQTSVSRDFPNPGAFAITGINWHLMGFEGSEESLENAEVMIATHVTQLFNPNPDYGMRRNVTLPIDTLNLAEDNSRYRSSYTDRVATLHRRASEAKVRASIPFGWADGTDDASQRKIDETLMENVKTRAKK
jgi:hypothetical protein